MEELEGIFTYLDALRDSGIVNMFGGATYLASDMGLAPTKARCALKLWMNTFDRNKSVQARATEALPDWVLNNEQQ